MESDAPGRLPMKWLFCLLLLSSLGCRREVQTICGTLRCPVEQTSISIFTVDRFGKPSKAAYIESFNFRTGRRHIDLQEWPNPVNGVSYKYRLFQSPSEFSSTGDAVSVTIRSMSGNESISYYKIAGGECSCNVSKLSGLDTIQID